MLSWNQIAGSVRCRCGSPAISAPPLALLAPATAQLLLLPPVARRPGGSDTRRWYASPAATASASVTWATGPIGVTVAWPGYGPGSYGDWGFGGSTGNHFETRSAPRDFSSSAITSGVSVKLSVCVMSPLTISESIGVHAFGW